tara:strand:+ start:568 stop:1026 length:459 start_codon:yes stop_codon:yes gene_type:complete
MSFKKKFINFEEPINFNTISNICSSGNYESRVTNRWNSDYILESIFQIKGIQNILGFKNLFIDLNNKFNEKKLKSDLDIFFSLVPGSRSNTHRDNYNVYIIGVYGRTLYKIENKEFIVNEGDLLHIKPNQLHTAIGLDPRIIVSFAVDEKPF